MSIYCSSFPGSPLFTHTLYISFHSIVMLPHSAPSQSHESRGPLHHVLFFSFSLVWPWVWVWVWVWVWILVLVLSPFSLALWTALTELLLSTYSDRHPGGSTGRTFSHHQQRRGRRRCGAGVDEGEATTS